MTQPEKETKIELIEYTADGEHGNAFLSAHSIPKGDALWKRNGVETTKEIRFERDLTPIGQKGAKLTAPVKDLPADVVKVLENTPGYKRVTL